MVESNGNGQDFVRLLSWVSPAFPTGGFAYSHALEWAVETGDITALDSLVDWISALLAYGSLRVDMIFVRHAWLAGQDIRQLEEIAAYACACASSRERYEETVYQGEAFLKAASVWDDSLMLARNPATRWPLPVAQGAVFRRGGAHAQQAVQAAGHMAVAALVSAAVRLVPLGQTDGRRAPARRGGALRGAGRQTAQSGGGDVGPAGLRAALAGRPHETQGTRLFRT
ncbi:MAG: urease accessory UreF family protein [Acetobacter papayae]